MARVWIVALVLAAPVGCIKFDQAVDAFCEKSPSACADGGSVNGVCTPDATESCYAGPADTLDIGACIAGVRTCAADGTWGECLGQVVPTAESCDAAEVDEDCDGWANESDVCTCTPQATLSCYSGPEGTEGVGLCQAGASICDDEGASWSACIGEVHPEAEEDCASPEDEDCDGQTYQQCPAQLWWAEKLSSSGGAVRGKDVAVDSEGNAYVVAEIEGTFWLNGEEHTARGVDILVMKFDVYGGLVWHHLLGSHLEDIASAIAVDANGNVAVVGSARGAVDGSSSIHAGGFDALVAYIDSSGALDWVKLLGADQEDQQANDVDFIKDGSLVVVGQFQGELDAQRPVISGGGWDAFVATLDWTSGMTGRIVQLGDAADQVATSVFVDVQSQRVTVAGTYVGAPESLPHSAGPNAYVAVYDPELLSASVSAVFNPTPTSSATVLRGVRVARAPAAGVGSIWLGGTFSGSLSVPGTSLTIDSDSGSEDVFLLKLGTAGGMQRFGGARTDVLGDLEVDASGRILIAGATESEIKFGDSPMLSTGGEDVFLAAFEETATTLHPIHLWSMLLGDSNLQRAIGVGVGNGQAVHTGAFRGSIRWPDETQLDADGTSDNLFVVTQTL